MSKVNTLSIMTFARYFLDFLLQNQFHSSQRHLHPNCWLYLLQREIISLTAKLYKVTQHWNMFLANLVWTLKCVKQVYFSFKIPILCSTAVRGSFLWALLKFLTFAHPALCRGYVPLLQSRTRMRNRPPAVFHCVSVLTRKSLELWTLSGHLALTE